MCVVYMPNVTCHLIFAPQQIQASSVDGRAEEVQTVVSNTEVQVSEAEHRPVGKDGASSYRPRADA